MAETVTFEVPDDLPRPDRQRIERVNRNQRIRAAYGDLRDEYGRDEAFRRLAEKHCLQPGTVRRIVYMQR